MLLNSCIYLLRSAEEQLLVVPSERVNVIVEKVKNNMCELCAEQKDHLEIQE